MDVTQDPRTAFMWVGRPGALVGVPGIGPDSYSVTPERALSTAETIGGGRRAQWVRRPRKWAVDVSLMPMSTLAPLHALAGGAHGNGPFQLVTPDMQVGNLLTPDEARLNSLPGGWAATGPVTASDGQHLPASMRGSGAVTIGAPVPAMKGVQLTASAYLLGQGAVTITGKNLAGGNVGSASSAPSAGGTAWKRVSVTWTPSVTGTSGAQLSVTGATQIAGPSVTWTSAPRPWVPGRGVRSVVVEMGGEDLTHGDEHDGVWEKTSFVAWEAY